MKTLNRFEVKTDWMMEQMRYDAIDKTFEEFKEACKYYHSTSDGGEEVIRLIKELERLGVDMGVIIETELDIRDEMSAK